MNSFTQSQLIEEKANKTKIQCCNCKHWLGTPKNYYWLLDKWAGEIICRNLLFFWPTTEDMEKVDNCLSYVSHDCQGYESNDLDNARTHEIFSVNK